jgi:hypothetical protein
MNIKEFGYYVEEHIREFLPEEIRESAAISIHTKSGINDTLKYGMIIRRGNEKISPVLYLENAWQAYKNGQDMNTVLENLAQQYMLNLDCQKDIYVDVPLEYESIKDRVIYQVLNKETNRNNLRERIYSDIGQGFVKVYAIHKELNEIGESGSIPITHNLMRCHGYDMEKIQEAAEKNTPQIYPAAFCGVEQTLFDGRQDELTNDNPDGEGLYYLSNVTRCRGAGVLFYPGMQEKIAEHFRESYYVLPSSVHEVLIVTEKVGKTAQELENTVRDINHKFISREDFLSNKVLMYDREKGQLRIALPDIPDLQLGDKKLER